MPDFWSHILCGEEVLNSFENNNYLDIIKNNIKIFNLGTLGGDIFYFYNFWPWRNDRGLRKTAGLLHTQKTGEFFIHSIDYLKERMFDKREFDELLSYISGFMCHYALDRNAHPFIYYFGGVYNKERPETSRFEGYHKKLEILIDTILLYSKKGMRSQKHPPYKEICIGKYIPESICNFYKYILQKLYGLDIDCDFINGSYLGMKKALKVLHDPLGIKVRIMKFLEGVINNKLEYSFAIYQSDIDDSHDYMNEHHNSWNHPCSKEETFNFSFYDLFDKGVVEGTEMIKTAIAFMEDNLDRTRLRNEFPNLSYLTGKSLENNCAMKYYKPIFEMIL